MCRLLPRKKESGKGLSKECDRRSRGISVGNKIGSGCEGDKRTYLHSISSALSVNSAVNLTMSS